LAKSPPFVGRHQELQRFDELLREKAGQAIVVVGPRGMGKTLLVNRMARCARNHPDLKCGAVRYEVTKTDSVDVTMSLMMDNAFAAAGLKEKAFDSTRRRSEQWRALLNVAKIGDLFMILRRDPQRNTREQFAARLDLISERLPSNGRAIFIIDPEKYMQTDSADDWRLVVRELPEKIKFVFAQRPDDVLINNSDFMALNNVVRVPDEHLDVLDEQAVEDLIELRVGDRSVGIGELREALTRYNRHPYAVPAAMDLIADGVPLAELPADPTPERIAEAQWKQVCDKHGVEAMELLRALAILEVAVPDDVVEAVAGLKTIELQKLLASNYIAGLLREEADGRRIYHSLLAEHLLSVLTKEEGRAYHRRAVDVYRRRLTANVKPDALAATRLPEHVLATEVRQAFVDTFVKECGQSLDRLGLLDSYVGLSEKALRTVTEGGVDEAILRGNLGVILMKRGDLDRAEEMHRAALKINEPLGRAVGAAMNYGNLGLIYQIRGELDRAEEMHRNSLGISEELGRPQGKACQYGNLGLVFSLRGDFTRAAEMQRKSLALHELLGLRDGVARNYANLGVVAHKDGDLDQAEKMHRKSLEISEELGDLQGVASSLGNLGLLCQERGDLDEAEMMHGRSLEISRGLGRPQGMAMQYVNLGLIYMHRGDLDGAEDLQRKSLGIAKSNRWLEGMALANSNLANNAKARGDPDAARTLWRQARNQYEMVGMPHMVAKVQSWLDELP